MSLINLISYIAAKIGHSMDTKRKKSRPSKRNAFYLLLFMNEWNECGPDRKCFNPWNTCSD